MKPQEASVAQDLIAPLQEILSNEYLQENNILNLLPAAVYVCDMSGIIKKYNEQAVKLWGRRPIPGDKDERFCGSYKLYNPDGSPLPHSQTPVAACLKDGLPRKDQEIIMERPDRSRIYVRVNIVPLKNKEGRQIGMINCFYDITDQKQTEKALQRKTIELQDYVDNAAIGLHWVDADGIIKWANKAELDMLGYTEEEYIGHHISEFHVKEEKINDILNRLSCSETLDQYESELRCKDGSIKTVHISSNVFWEDGKFIHTRCFTIDVTERKKLYDDLKESEERNRSILKGLSIAIYTCDKNGYITFYNDAAVQLWGREPETGKDLWCGSWKINRPDGSPLPLDTCPMAVCLKECRAVYGEEIIVFRPDGDVRHVLPYPQPLFDSSGNMTGAINMLMDITELKKNERALRESESNYRKLAASLEKKVEEKILDLRQKNEELKKSEERYHKMVEEVEDYAIILLDKNGIVQNWNKGAEKIKGYREEEIVGKSFQEFYLPGDRKKQLPAKMLKEALTKGKADYEGWRIRKDGTIFWGSIVLTALHDDENNIIGFSKVTRDLTARKLAEDKLQEYATQLKFQNEQLEEFAYAASHDMKEPLRKILFYNNHLWDTTAEKLNEKEREYLNRSLNSARRMAKLIDDLLEYSRATSESQHFELVDLNEIVDEIILLHKDVIEQNKASVIVTGLPLVRAIPFQMRQLFDNLITNALKYYHPDRSPMITITTQTINVQEDFRLDPEKSHHKISVCDNGVGFEEEYSEKIFELFQRLSTTRYHGTGVGLALCKKIAQNHHGIIKGTGRLNEGACFEIYLPVESGLNKD